MMKDHRPEPARRAPEPHQPASIASAALRAPEVATIAAAARAIWNRQGGGGATDSLGRVWTFSVAPMRAKLLRVQVGTVWEDVGQDKLGIVDSEVLLATVQRLDAAWTPPAGAQAGG
jgi:hypothetical protein